MRRILIALVLLSLTACTSRYQVRGTEMDRAEGIPLNVFLGREPEKRVTQIATEHRSIEKFDDFTIGILEINDDGNVNNKQKNLVMNLVRREMKDGGLVVVFVHGWHHGPRTCDRDLCCFRTVMAHISANRKKIHPDEKVVGVYVGWRGESIARRGINLTTIANRKSVAERIGRTAGKEFLLELDEMWMANSKMRLVSVGHSLGGAFLFKAAKGKLTGNIADIEDNHNRSYRVTRARCDREAAFEKKTKALRAGIGDLMVLVNPAIEASEYTAFDKDLKDKAWEGVDRDTLVRNRLPYDKNDPYDEGQFPVILTLASKADTAVGVIFPIARYLTFHTGSAAVGMGRFGPHVTHQLQSRVEPIDPTDKKIRNARARLATGCSCMMAADAPDIPDGKLDLTRSGEHMEFGDFVMDLDPARAKRGWDPNSPYYVIQTTAKIAAEHSDIFNKEFVGFLTAFITSFDRHKSYERNRGCPPGSSPTMTTAAATPQ